MGDLAWVLGAAHLLQYDGIRSLVVSSLGYLTNLAFRIVVNPALEYHFSAKDVLVLVQVIEQTSIYTVTIGFFRSP